jgi:putative aldouronate transport system permease protein
MSKKISHEAYYISMLLPGIIMLCVFSIIPMLGIVIAFQRYVPARGILGSEFVGLRNFQVLFTMPNTIRVIQNTLIIAVTKIILNIAIPVFFALFLNECRVKWLKRTMQTIVYLPNFLSWVIVAAMFVNIFSVTGVVNAMLSFFGNKRPIVFMANNTWFRPIVIFADVWKNFGFNAIVYIAAITGIDPNLYESAETDGAGRWQKMFHITLPSIASAVVLMSTLALGNILNAGFDQVFNMYNPAVYQTGDILDTFTFRLAFGGSGIFNVQRFDLSTAVGLFKSLISFVLIIISYRLAYKFADYTIF